MGRHHELDKYMAMPSEVTCLGLGDGRNVSRNLSSKLQSQKARLTCRTGVSVDGAGWLLSREREGLAL